MQRMRAVHFGFPLQGPTPGCGIQTSSQVSAPPASASFFFGHFQSMTPSELPLGRVMPGEPGTSWSLGPVPSLSAGTHLLCVIGQITSSF